MIARQVGREKTLRGFREQCEKFNYIWSRNLSSQHNMESLVPLVRYTGTYNPPFHSMYLSYLDLHELIPVDRSILFVISGRFSIDKVQRNALIELNLVFYNNFLIIVKIFVSDSSNSSFQSRSLTLISPPPLPFKQRSIFHPFAIDATRNIP